MMGVSGRLTLMTVEHDNSGCRVRGPPVFVTNGMR